MGYIYVVYGYFWYCYFFVRCLGMGKIFRNIVIVFSVDLFNMQYEVWGQRLCCSVNMFCLFSFGNEDCVGEGWFGMDGFEVSLLKFFLIIRYVKLLVEDLFFCSVYLKRKFYQG